MKLLPVLMIGMALVAHAAGLSFAESTEGQQHDITWLTNIDEAFAQAHASNKPVFLDFFNSN